MMFGALVVACSDQVGDVYVHFSNKTNGPIDIVVLYPDTNQEYVLETGIAAGTTSVTRSDVYPNAPCADRGILIARDAQGSEIARRTGQICKGDTWNVGGAPSASPSRRAVRHSPAGVPRGPGGPVATNPQVRNEQERGDDGRGSAIGAALHERGDVGCPRMDQIPA